MKVRFVALVPIEFEEEIIGDNEFITQWGREYLEVSYDRVDSIHGQRSIPYEPMLCEAVKVEEDNTVADLGDLIAPGLIT